MPAVLDAFDPAFVLEPVETVPEAVYFCFSSRRRHTRLQGDWSSDVCSSDLDRDAVRTEGKQLERRADALRNLPRGISGHWTKFGSFCPGQGLGQTALWNHFRECPVSPWGRWRSHRHEDRISCCNCDSCRCRQYWTGGPFCRLAAARKAVHACRRPIGDPVS